MMPQTAELIPDLDAARHFLLLLDEEAEQFCFQTFDDLKARKDRALATVFTCDLSQCERSLRRLQQRGAGVFVTVNETDGKGRKLENIQRIRAIWHEEDIPCGKDFPLEPHIIVESSPGKFHRYWLVDGLPIEQFGGVMERMIADFNSDPNVKDIARVLRLPGFFHLKDPAHPFQVRIIHESGRLPYSAEELLEAFPPRVPSAALSVPAAAGDSVPANPSAWKALVTELASKAAKRTHEQPTLGRHAMVLWLGRECAHRAVPVTAAAYALKVFANLMRPTDASGKAAPMNIESETKSFQDAHAAGLKDPPEKRQNYMPRPPGARGPIRQNIVDFTSENEARLAYEKRIDETEDFDTLVYVLFEEIEASGWRQATKDYLGKRIAKKTRVGLGALRAGMAGAGGGPPREGSRGGDWVAGMNERHAIVTMQGATRIANFERDPVFDRLVVTFSSRADFVLRYENRPSWCDGESWLKSQQRREYEGIAFAPGIDLGPRVYNLWQGFGVEATPGGPCGQFLDLVRDVICAGDEETYAYVWGWMAHLIQRPAELPGTALVLRGLQGTGKNTFAETLGRLVNPAHFVALTHMDHLTGKFSLHRAGALLLFANEASWGGDRQSEGNLKALVTDADTLMEAKHRDALKVRNFARLIVATNRDWPVPRDEDDRRFVVLEVSDARKEDAEYFGAIKRELEAGGYETLMHLLQTADIEGWHPRQIPVNLRERGWDMKIRSGGSVMEWYFECLEAGVVVRDAEAYGDQRWRTQIPTKDVQETYVAWCRRRGYSHVANIRDLGNALARWRVGRIRPRTEGARPWCYLFPGLSQARRAFAEAITMPAEYWEGE